jgi:transposase
MARYKDSSFTQSKFIPVVFSQQITPGTFEHTITFLIDEHLDMSVFDARYKNDTTGRLAYEPAMLLRVILSAYARGFTSSRQIERLCKENVVFIALSGDAQPHFTTIANFIAQMGDVIQDLFTEVLMVCDAQGLIGGELFAIDGCKMPSNASKEWSGTLKEMTKKHKKIDRAVRRMLKKHREEDDSVQVNDHSRRAAEEKNIASLRKASRKIKKFCATSEERRGLSGKVIKSNITDNDSASMLTSHGNLQGYNGVAAVDAQNQIVIAAQAFGQGPENNLLKPLVEQARSVLGDAYIEGCTVTADAGFHSSNTLEYCQNTHLDALIADGNFRKRDPRFINRNRYVPKKRKARWFMASEFDYDPHSKTCRCPAGKQLWRRNSTISNGHRYVCYSGYLKDCRNCPLQEQCMRKPPKEQGRQVSFRVGTSSTRHGSVLDKMKARIDSDQGRYLYGKRLGTVEPVFGNINTTKGLNRFSHRGRRKVNAQWMMYCLVHNVEKLQHYGQLACI